MKYIIFTTRHHDGFCLFNTEETDFNTINAPAKRDLVAELESACEARGIGLFLYYSYGIDWRHPYAPLNSFGVPCAKPVYNEPEPYYLCKNDEDVKKYIDFMHKQLTELLTGYGSVAGVWFDLISAAYFRPDLYPVHETYALIRKLQPHALISFKQGVNGEEDYMSQEIQFVPLKDRLIKMRAPAEAIELSEKVWNMHIDKWNEVCSIMQDKHWGYARGAKHKNADDIMELLAKCLEKRCNLAINTCLLPDGSVHKKDEEAFKEVGRRLSIIHVKRRQL